MGRFHSGEGLQFRDALDEGAKAFNKSTHPDQLRADMAGMSPSEYLGYVQGARGQVRDTIGNAASALRQNGDIRAMQQLGSPYAREKLELISPYPGVAKRLTDRLDAEARHADTYNRVVEGSPTAQRQAAQKEFPTAAEITATPDYTHMTATGIGIQGARKIVDALRAGALTQKQVQIAADAAKMLIAQGAERDAVRNGLITYMHNQGATLAQKRAIEYVATVLGRSAIEPASPDIQPQAVQSR